MNKQKITQPALYHSKDISNRQRERNCVNSTSDIRRSKNNAQKVFDFLVFCVFEEIYNKIFLRNPLAALFESREEENEEKIITWNRSKVIYLMMRVKI